MFVEAGVCCWDVEDKYVVVDLVVLFFVEVEDSLIVVVLFDAFAVLVAAAEAVLLWIIVDDDVAVAAAAEADLWGVFALVCFFLLLVSCRRTMGGSMTEWCCCCSCCLLLLLVSHFSFRCSTGTPSLDVIFLLVGLPDDTKSNDSLVWKGFLRESREKNLPSHVEIREWMELYRRTVSKEFKIALINGTPRLFVCGLSWLLFR